MPKIARRTRLHRPSSSVTLRTSVPQVVAELLELKAEDEIEWVADTTTSRVSVRKAPATGRIHKGG